MLTEDTPNKVMGMLAVSMLSLSFLFMVSLSDASFEGTRASVPNPFSPAKVLSFLNADPFGPENLMPAVDAVASSYSKFLAAAIIEPASRDIAYFSESAKGAYAFVLEDNSQDILESVGLADLAWQEPTPMARVNYRPPQVAKVEAQADEQVAGAFTLR